MNVLWGQTVRDSLCIPARLQYLLLYKCQTFIFALHTSDLIVAESDDLISTSSPNSESRTYSPGPVLTPDELRKMSLLSSLSVTIPLDQDFNVRAVSPTGCHLRNNVTSNVSKWYLFSFTQKFLVCFITYLMWHACVLVRNISYLIYLHRRWIT